jgi:hypothetical protein
MTEENNVKGEENRKNQKGKKQKIEERVNKFEEKNVTLPLPFLHRSYQYHSTRNVYICKDSVMKPP